MSRVVTSQLDDAGGFVLSDVYEYDTKVDRTTVYDTHISARITVEDLAVYTNLSASYLSRLFKQNVGVSISDYIREKKIEKAQNLLRFSDFTYIQIANYLSFSSQSHFIQTFQHYVGMTPKQYRSSKYKSTW